MVGQRAHRRVRGAPGSGLAPAAARRARVAGAILASALAASVLVAAAPPEHEPPGPATAQAARGAERYAFACAACHGGGGRGFEEAVEAFPEPYRSCTSCHQPQNAAQMPGSQVGLATMAFSLGSPPPLADAARLRRYGTAAALYHYVRTSMPRWAPGSLTDEEYLDVVAHVLVLAGLLGADETLPMEALGDRRLD